MAEDWRWESTGLGGLLHAGLSLSPGSGTFLTRGSWSSCITLLSLMTPTSKLETMMLKMMVTVMMVMVIRRNIPLMRLS